MSHRLSAALALPEGFPAAPWSRKRWKYRRGTWGWAICAATLFPVVRKPLPEQYRGWLPSWVPNQAYHLHTLRAHQLNELRKAGYEHTPYNFICPPSFVETTQAFWTCRDIWCPFCWGRLVALATYERLRHIDKVYFQTHLIAEVRAHEFISYDLPDEQIRERISTAAQRVCRQLKLLTTSPGLFKLTTVEPTDSGCRVTVRVIAFVTPKFAEKRRATTSPELDVVYQKLYGANYEFAKLVGRVCEYPFELLFQPAAEVKRVLELRQGLRLMSSSGVFRERTKPDEQEDESLDQRT